MSAKNNLLFYEQQCWSQSLARVAGIDEAGRGPLAGSVVAAAVVFPPDAAFAFLEGELSRLTDSKQLTSAQRDRFFEWLTNQPDVQYGVGVADVAEIDAVNILQATYRAMRRAVSALSQAPQHLLVDGRAVPGLSCASTPIVKGDQLSLSIAAASVIAKVTRDREMEAMDERYPGYGFGRHKGYGTAEHLAAIRERGVTPIHRRSFRPVREVIEADRLSDVTDQLELF